MPHTHHPKNTFMTHQQITDKLAARYLVQSMEEDIARLTWEAMTFDKNKYIDDQLSHVLPKLLLRWNCVLDADRPDFSEGYKQKTIVALITLLHKYGYADTVLTAKGFKAIDALNEAVLLSDDFFRKSEEIKQVLSAAPVPLKRKPSIPDSITFYRVKDVISFQLGERYYAAYVHSLSAPNESPVLEFYDAIFDKVPSLQELEKVPAKGERYQDGTERIARFSVSGMKFLPDLAHQIQLISACVENNPSGKHLQKPHGLYTVGDLFSIQESIRDLFHEPGK